MSVSLVIGGTGMLAEATRWLAARSDETLLVARRASRFAAETPGTVPLDLDWSEKAFKTSIAAALVAHGPVAVALLWIHDPAPILAWLLPLLADARVVLVLGGMDGRPSVPEWAQELTVVRLGRVATATGRRWLTHEEISAGAVAALEDGQSRLVGRLG